MGEFESGSRDEKRFLFKEGCLEIDSMKYRLFNVDLFKMISSLKTSISFNNDRMTYCAEILRDTSFILFSKKLTRQCCLIIISFKKTNLISILLIFVIA